MRSDRTFSEILEGICYVVACVFWVAFLALSVAVLCKTFVMDVVTPGRKWLHFYFAVGFVAFIPLLLIPRVRHNVGWLATFTHELTHTVFALLFFRKMSAFVVDGKDDRASFSGGWLGYKTITLSPYCVPIITLALLPWRFTTGDPVFLSAIDFLIGLTYLLLDEADPSVSERHQRPWDNPLPSDHSLFSDHRSMHCDPDHLQWRCPCDPENLLDLP